MNYLLQKIRRLYLVYFRPEYVRTQLANRKGVCGHHGCCSKSIGGKILIYFKGCFEKGRCKRWDNLPYACRTYPIDKKDIVKKFRNICNFYWT